MAIGPVGAATYANQAMPVQATQQTSYQNRLDMQNALAASIADENKEEIEEVRPAEETYKIDPENEHEKEKSKEEQSFQEREKKEEEESSQEDGDLPKTSHLDIKV